MIERTMSSQGHGRRMDVQPGDRFRQVWPPSGAMLIVERRMDAEHVAVERDNGARQVFPVESLLNPEWWVRVHA